MSAFGTVVIYVIVWWLSFIAALPWGVRSQLEQGLVEAGTDPGAPARPLMLRKMLAATLIAAILTACVWVVMDRGWFEAWLRY